MPVPRPSDDAPDSTRFIRTRAAHSDETAEDYVEAIDSLIAQHGQARVGDLARLMGVSHVTVSRIIARLAKPDVALVETAPYRPIILTAKGKRLAARARERHQIVADFLRAIGVPDAQAEIDAEGIEHHASQATLDAMKATTARLRADQTPRERTSGPGGVA